MAEEFVIKQTDYKENKHLYNNFVLWCFFHDIGHLLVYENNKL